MSFTRKIASVNVQILKFRMASCKNNSDFQNNCNTLTNNSAYVSSDSDVGKHFWKWRATSSGWNQKRGVRWRTQRCSRGKTLPRGPIRLACPPIKLLTLLGKTWLRHGLWNVLMGHILDPTRETGDFQKPTFITYFQIGRIELDWFVIFQESIMT